MTTWMELHCDVLRDAEPGSTWRPPRCFSHDNNNPGVMVGNAQQSVSHGFKILAAQAKSLGWKRKRGIGWVCPHCQAMEP